MHSTYKQWNCHGCNENPDDNVLEEGGILGEEWHEAGDFVDDEESGLKMVCSEFASVPASLNRISCYHCVVKLVQAVKPTTTVEVQLQEKQEPLLLLQAIEQNPPSGCRNPPAPCAADECGL